MNKLRETELDCLPLGLGRPTQGTSRLLPGGTVTSTVSLKDKASGNAMSVPALVFFFWFVLFVYPQGEAEQKLRGVKIPSLGTVGSCVSTE